MSAYACVSVCVGPFSQLHHGDSVPLEYTHHPSLLQHKPLVREKQCHEYKLNYYPHYKKH